MYRFSRSIYRDLAPYVIGDPQNGHGDSHGEIPVNAYGHANGNGRRNGGREINGNGAVKREAAARGGNHQRLLDACEAAMRRLAYDRRYFAHPARSLFSEVRMLFPIHEQDRVFRVIDRNVKLALEHLARLPEGGIGLDGQPSECRAHTRKGTPCQRQPLPGRDYCPSHKHLEESLEPVEDDADAGVLDERAAAGTVSTPA
jgi:hypothetical protein